MPLAVVLIPYAILVLLFAIFSFVNLYHLIRFGFLTFASFSVAFLYLAVIVLILFATASALSGVDWSSPLLELGPRTPSLGL